MNPYPLSRTVVASIVAVILAACGDDAPVPAGGAQPEPSAQEAGAPETPATADEGVEAPASIACVEGWTDPEDPEQRELPFHVIRRTLKVDGEFRVEEMRYFEGPESPPSVKGYLQVVDRWYVKAALEGQPRFRARWLIEERTFGSGVVAVAPYESTGFEPGDWIGFQYEGGDAPRAGYPDIPGRWTGRPYDFVTGADLETSEAIFRFSGLPPEVIGCLEGT